MFGRLRKIGIVPALLKLKHLFLTPDKQIVTLASQNGAYAYLLRYKHAAAQERTYTPMPRIRTTEYVWVCWLQGLENAPKLVQVCVDSIRKNHPNRKVVVLTDENIAEYVSVPEYVLRKYQQGCMTRTHYSDIIRLLLLSQYGGVWMDSTILMTGSLPEYIEQSSFFAYHSATELAHVCCATGFMAACAHHPIVEDTLQILLEYWKHETKLVSYSVIHLLIYMATHDINDANRQYWKEVPLYYYTECEKLRIALDEPYDDASFFEIQRVSSIHKLTYKFDEYKIHPEKKNTFYDKLINQGLC